MYSKTNSYAAKKALKSEKKDTRGRSKSKESSKSKLGRPKSKETPKKEEPKIQIVPKIRGMLLEDEGQDLIKICKHKEPNEDYQFFSFTHDRLLASDDLVSGAYIGCDILNIKKASERIREKISNNISKAKARLENITSLMEKLKTHQDLIASVANDYKAQIKSSFGELRRLIDEKEKEILSEADLLVCKKRSELDNSNKELSNSKQEVDSIIKALTNHIQKLDDYALCKYFSYRSKHIGSLINDKDVDLLNIKHTIETKALPDQLSITGFIKHFEILRTQLDSLPGIDDLSQERLDALIRSTERSRKSLSPKKTLITIEDSFGAVSTHSSKGRESTKNASRYAQLGTSSSKKSNLKSQLDSAVKEQSQEKLVTFADERSTFRDETLSTKRAQTASTTSLRRSTEPAKKSIEEMVKEARRKIVSSKKASVKPVDIFTETLEMYSPKGSLNYLISPDSSSIRKSIISRFSTAIKRAQAAKENPLTFTAISPSLFDQNLEGLSQRGPDRSLFGESTKSRKSFGIGTSFVDELKNSMIKSTPTNRKPLRESNFLNILQANTPTTREYSPHDITLLGLLKRQQEMFEKKSPKYIN